MEDFLKCDFCMNQFDNNARVPKVLPKWGHTLCLNWVRKSVDKWSLCKTNTEVKSMQEFATNEKLMKMINSGFPKAVSAYNQVPPKPKALENMFGVQADPSPKMYATMPTGEEQNTIFMTGDNMNSGLNVGSK